MEGWGVAAREEKVLGGGWQQGKKSVVTHRGSGVGGRKGGHQDQKALGGRGQIWGLQWNKGRGHIDQGTPSTLLPGHRSFFGGGHRLRLMEGGQIALCLLHKWEERFFFVTRLNPSTWLMERV